MFISRRARDEFQFSLRDIREDEEREKEWAEEETGREEGKQSLKRAKESESEERTNASWLF